MVGGGGDKIKIEEPLVLVISKTWRNINFHEWIGKEPQFFGFHYVFFFEILEQVPWFLSTIEIENHTNNHKGFGAILHTFRKPLLSLPLPLHILMPCSCTRAYEQIDQEFVYVRSAIWRLCNQKKGDKKNCIKMIFNTSTIYESTNANGSNYMHHRKDIQRNTNSLFILQNW